MFFVVISSMGAEQSGSFRIAFAMEKEERKLALKMGKTHHSTEL
jgi:hypothetical protein